MNKIVICILLVAGLLVSIWFRNGYIFGVAEDGLIFYNLQNYFHQSQYTWMEYPGLGSPSLTLIAGKPTYFVLSYLQDAGVSGFLIQAAVMWFLLVSSGIGVYLLIQELFPKLPNRFLMLGVFFYWFNPISLADVWNRFLLNYIFFFALLPVATYLYIKGLRNKKIIWAFLLNIILILYSYSFSYIAFTLLLWIWLFLLTFYHSLFSRGKGIIFFSIKYFILNILLFSLISSWWILPLVFLNISGGATPTTNLFLNQNNTGLLDALSKSVGNLTGIFKLTNASFLSSDSLDWVKTYSVLLFPLMFIIVGIIINYIIRLRKEINVLFLASLLLTAIFLSKGNNPPLGEIYDLIYEKIIFLQVFRNPFEKFGYILALISALLLSPGIYELTIQTKGILKKLLTPFFYAAILFYLGLPLFTGLIFTNKFPPTNNYSIGYKVKVPDYYLEANNYLKKQGNNFRYIGLPLKDEGITYDWEKGYAGVELNVALFNNSGIIHNTSVPFFNQIIPQIEKAFISDANFSDFASLLNAKFYVLRYDVDYKSRGMTDPKVIEGALNIKEQKGEVKHVADFGKVSIWENLKWQDTTFYAAKKMINIKSFNDYFDLSKINTLQREVLIDRDEFEKVNNIIGKQLTNIVPDIAYEKINKTKYILHIKNASTPFLLVFSELYNNGWKATFFDGKKAENHIRVNFYGNGWIIDKKGDYTLEVEFAPQNFMDIGEKISFASYALIFAGLSILKMKHKI